MRKAELEPEPDEPESVPVFGPEPILDGSLFTMEPEPDPDPSPPGAGDPWHVAHELVHRRACSAGDIGELPEQLADHGLPRAELDRADPLGLELAVTNEGTALDGFDEIGEVLPTALRGRPPIHAASVERTRCDQQGSEVGSPTGIGLVSRRVRSVPVANVEGQPAADQAATWDQTVVGDGCFGTMPP